ncbi:FGGY-family carbohydrate kinase [Treponema sp.]
MKNATGAILCADIGTSSLKAALIDFEGHLHAFAREAYPAERVASGNTRALDWEQAFALAVLALRKEAEKQALEIQAICISGNGPGFVPVGEDDRAFEVLHWHDGKKSPARNQNSKDLPSLFLPHAAWLLQEREKDYQKTKHLFSSQEWLSWRLGAEPITILPSPAYEQFYWDEAQLKAYELDATKFPRFVEPGVQIGRVSEAAAENFKLEKGIPIVSGGPDFITALIGVGAIESGIVCDRAGTSEGINVCADKPSTRSDLRTLPHVIDTLWNVSAMLPTTGRLFEWFRTITGQTDRDYRQMLEEIVGASPRSFVRAEQGGFFFPDLRKRGSLSISSAFFSTAGLTTRPELGRAVVEAIGFMVRSAVDKLENAGYPIAEMRLSGGQAKNELWNHLKANMVGRRLIVPEIEDGELAGNACLSLCALGQAANLEQAVARIVRMERSYEPDQAEHSYHSERYASYEGMLSKIDHLFI